MIRPAPDPPTRARSRDQRAAATTDVGDRIPRGTAKLTPEGDCPVHFVNYETTETKTTWPAIALFLADAIEPSNA